MALTVTRTGDWRLNQGDRNASVVTIAFDSSYPTGGESLSAADLGLGTLDFVNISPKSGYVFEYDYTNQKVLVYTSAGFTPAGTVAGTAAGQVFTGSALATHTHDLKVIGGQAAAGTAAVSAPAATDLLGKEEAGDADILGADVATKGGVVAITGGTPAGTNAASALTATFTGTAVAAGAMAQVANATNLATLTDVRVYAVGRP